MEDSRLKALADIFVNYSLEVKKGEHILIRADEPEALPLMEEIYIKILEKGGYPLIRIKPEIFDYLLAKHASKKQIENFLDTEIYELNKVQGRIKICAPKNPKMMANVDSGKLALVQKKLGMYRKYLDKVKWLLFYYPTEGLAQQMEMSLKETENFIFKACLKDWRKETEKMKKIKKFFDGGKIVRIKGNETDIAFSIEGRKGELSGGKHNMPGGEAYYAPIENSINGQIFFEGSRSYEGKAMKDIFLEFKNGRITKIKAESGQDFLTYLTKIDRGAARIGEFGIGCNYDLNRITNETLFDEKIGGTIHLALGDRVNFDGKNRSILHFDIVKDLRKEGKIYLDGKLVQEKGKFIFL
ncbi:MAG: aminopeptidase [bacterium]|nr:aminopeptidase [bacterium]